MKPVSFAFAFLLCAASVADPKGAGKVTETEDEAMITQVEEMGKSIQAALNKIAAQMKAGGNSSDAKKNLEQLSESLQKNQAAMKDKAARTPGADGAGATSEMLQALKSFIQGMTSKVIENANQTVDKLNKMSDEAQ
jgi:hypothetical protein